MKFEDFNLPAPIMQAIKEIGYDTPTQIQEKSIPLIMQGKDVIGQSGTGSGKTATFGLPILGKVQRGKGLQVLILTPTRELCVQVAASLQQFSKYLGLRVCSIYGGVGMNPQINGIRVCEIVVACPGRLLDIMSQGHGDFRGVRFMILDEADRMLDMGFIRDVEKIIRVVPKDRQTLLFSATMEPELRSLVNKYMRNPEFVQAKIYVDTSLLKEAYFEVDKQDKFSLLAHLLKNETPGIALVFCRTRRIVDKVTKGLQKSGVEAMAIHGGLSQNKRDRALDSFKDKESAVLVATDIAGRGLHIEDITHVYNYDVPHVSDDYVHRIGRTARAGKAGDAVTFVTREDQGDWSQIMRRTKRNVQRSPLPHFEKIAPVMGGQSSDRHGGPPRVFSKQGQERGHYGGARPGQRERMYGGSRDGNRPSNAHRTEERGPRGHSGPRPSHGGSGGHRSEGGKTEGDHRPTHHRGGHFVEKSDSNASGSSGFGRNRFGRSRKGTNRNAWRRPRS